MYKEFYDQVKEMRRLQNDYDCQSETLKKIQQYERRVDIIIEQIEVATAKINGTYKPSK